MGYTDPGFYVEREMLIPSITLSATSTALIHSFGRKVAVTGLAAFVTTSTGGTPVIKALNGSIAAATLTAIGAAQTTVAGAIGATPDVGADENLTIAVTDAGSAGVANIVLRYKDKF